MKCIHCGESIFPKFESVVETEPKGFIIHDYDIINGSLVCAPFKVAEEAMVVEFPHLADKKSAVI
ncbi:MAG: hypothetical protein WAV15_01150 [Minisyncoccia bacterium]